MDLRPRYHERHPDHRRRGPQHRWRPDRQPGRRLDQRFTFSSSPTAPKTIGALVSTGSNGSGTLYTNGSPIINTAPGLGNADIYLADGNLNASFTSGNNHQR